MELGQDHDLIARVQNKIRIVPDFPKPNTRFRDLSQVVESDPDLFRAIIDSMANRHRASRQDRILCIESWVTFWRAPGVSLGPPTMPGAPPRKAAG
jgi:hypothetical protein